MDTESLGLHRTARIPWRPGISSKTVLFFLPLPLIDFVAIVPLYLSTFFDIISAQSLIELRLLRLLQLVRFFTPLVVLWRVVRTEAPAMLGAIFIVVVLIIIASSGMYLV